MSSDFSPNSADPHVEDFGVTVVSHFDIDTLSDKQVQVSFNASIEFAGGGVGNVGVANGRVAFTLAEPANIQFSGTATGDTEWGLATIRATLFDSSGFVTEKKTAGTPNDPVMLTGIGSSGQTLNRLLLPGNYTVFVDITSEFLLFGVPGFDFSSTANVQFSLQAPTPTPDGSPTGALLAFGMIGLLLVPKGTAVRRTY